jgi:hypothetical protein
MQLPRKDGFVGQSIQKLIPRGGHKPQGFLNDKTRPFVVQKVHMLSKELRYVLLMRKCTEQLLGQGWKCLGIAQKGKKYASHSNSISPDRRGRSVVVGEPLHTNARHDQIDPEWGRSDCGGIVAPKHFWTFSFSREYTRRNVNQCR